MILGYVSIGFTIAAIISLSIYKASKVWPYYAGIYIVGALMLLSTTLASSQLVGSDIHIEYYFASRAANGWDPALNCTINSCLPIVLAAPFVSWLFHIDLIWVFKIVIPLFYALTPVLLLYIYSRFIPVKWAFLSAMVFIIVPTYFLEMTAISRQQIAELLMVAVIALLVSKQRYEYKFLGVLFGSLAVVVSHYSMVPFWLIILFTTLIAYYFTNQGWRTLDIGVVLGASFGLFLWYSNWVASGWIMVDYNNVINGITNSVMSSAAPSVVPSVVPSVAPSVVSNSTPVISSVGIPVSANINWIPLVTTLILIFGIYRMIRSKDISKLYKYWIVMAYLLLILANVYPAVSNSVNYTRYYHMMLIFLAPAVVFTFYKFTVPLTATCLIGVFIFSSGLLFNILQIDNLEKTNIPYSIALENEKLDAGTYLNSDDAAVAKWAYENGYKRIYGDTGGVLIAQSYYLLYDVSPIKDTYQPSEVIIVRTWNTLHGWSKWVGPGLRHTVPLSLPEGHAIYQSGKAYIWEVE